MDDPIENAKKAQRDALPAGVLDQEVELFVKHNREQPCHCIDCERVRSLFQED